MSSTLKITPSNRGILPAIPYHMQTVLCFSLLFCLSIFLFLHGCAKSENTFYIPSHPYDAAALMHCDVPVRGLDDLLTLLEKRLQMHTLPDYLAVQKKVDKQIGCLIGAIDLASGTRKYGDPGFADPQFRAMRVLFGFSLIQTQYHLDIGVEIVEDMKHLIRSYHD